MNEDIGKLMDEVLSSSIEGLKSMEAGSEVKTAEVDNVVKLYKARVEHSKIEFDCDEKRERLKMDVEASADESINRSKDDEFKINQLDMQKKELIVKYGIIGAEAASWILFAWVMAICGFQFETNEVFKSKTFANLYRFIVRPKK